MRILIVKPSSLGDVLHAFPAVNILAKSFPDLQIDWMIHPAFAELLDYVPHVERKILFHRKELGHLSTFFQNFLPLVKELRAGKYDLVIDLQGLLRSAFFARLAKAPLHYGPENARERSSLFFYSDTMKYPAELRHAVEKNMAMIQTVKGVRNFLEEKKFTLPVVEKYRSAALKILKEAGLEEKEFIVIAPGARWKTKEWPSAFFAEVIRLVREKEKIRFVISGAPSEKGKAAKILSLAKKEEVTDLTGKTTAGSMIELIRASALLVCNDSGPMHAGAACGVPVVAFFGPTDPELTGPWCEKKKVFVPELDCVRCFRKECPDMRCHKALSPQEAADSVLAFLHREGRTV